jgi:hypothetical protein
MSKLIEILNIYVRDYSVSEEANANSTKNKFPESGSSSSSRSGDPVFKSAGVPKGLWLLLLYAAVKMIFSAFYGSKVASFACSTSLF